MSSAPFVSIIVPVYNCESYLDDCLRSLAEQTYADFEVIVSDDASTDDSLKVATRWQHSDSRFKAYRHTHNVGMTRNWNQGLGYASGDFIMKLDADDCYEPETIERLAQAVVSTHTDIAFCRTLECDHTLAVLDTYRGELALVNAGIDPTKTCVRAASEWYQLAFDDKQLWHSNAFMVPRTLMTSINGWDERFGCASDTDLILRLLEQDVNVAHLAYQGVLYRMREGSVSDDFRRNDKLVDEGYAVNLNSLNRTYQAGGRISYAAKLNWYRLYQNNQHRHARKNQETTAQASGDASKDALFDASALTLPLTIRVLGAAQRCGHKIKKTLLN